MRPVSLPDGPGPTSRTAGPSGGRRLCACPIRGVEVEGVLDQLVEFEKWVRSLVDDLVQDLGDARAGAAQVAVRVETVDVWPCQDEHQLAWHDLEDHVSGQGLRPALMDVAVVIGWRGPEVFDLFDQG